MPEETLAALLAQKEEMDSSDPQAPRSYERWIADALEALLRTITVKAQEAKTPLPAQRR